MSIPSGEPPIGGTLSVIRSLLPALVPSERRVAAQFLEHPAEISLLSVADVAARANVSAATVIRTCKNLGFKGFQHLRLLLVRDFGSVQSPRDQRLDATASQDWVPAYFAAAAQRWSEALGTLDYAQFDSAAAALARARRILIVGNGGSGPPAQLFALYMLSRGQGCEAPMDSVTQQLSARTLDQRDVVVAVSDSGENAVTLQAVTAAKGTGATIIAISGYARSQLCVDSDLALVAGAGHTGITDSEAGVASNVVQILLLFVLNTAIAREAGQSAEPTAAVRDQVMTLVSKSERAD
ncbi:MurR/RpiR family transcriptional regulator [Nocardia arizonensis]|uniref:MurR/RpiR family transcriptional regulator n=1 Tax=Nocardia arizonensis TaxID=1141647 RepID=UPI0006D15250|nr:MurR/RpiR family transcriptional regulator [Nocardia arizonensis]